MKKNNTKFYCFLCAFLLGISTCGADHSEKFDLEKAEDASGVETQVIADAAENEDASISGIPYSLQFKGEASEDIIEEFKNISMLVRLS